MADSQENGKLAYDLTEEETMKLIEDYKEKVLSGEVVRPCIPHWISTTGYTEEEVAEVIRRGTRETANAYTRRAQAIVKLFSWIRGVMFQAPGWAGQMKGAAIFLLSQDFGDGVRWKEPEKNEKQGGNQYILSFGGNDKRASKAAK